MNFSFDWQSSFREKTLSQGGSTWNLALIDEVVLEKKMFENNGLVHVCSPGAGLEHRQFQNHKYSVIWSVAARFPHWMTF